MKVLITGGAGFIGSNFINHHINNTENLILNLDKMTYAGCQLSLECFAENPNYTFVEGDICNKKLVDEVLKKFKPNYIGVWGKQTKIHAMKVQNFKKRNILIWRWSSLMKKCEY